MQRNLPFSTFYIDSTSRMIKIYVLGFAKWEFDKAILDGLSEEDLIQIYREDVEHVTVRWATLDEFAHDNNCDNRKLGEVNPSEYYIYFIFENLR